MKLKIRVNGVNYVLRKSVERKIKNFMKDTIEEILELSFVVTMFIIALWLSA